MPAAVPLSKIDMSKVAFQTLVTTVLCGGQCGLKTCVNTQQESQNELAKRVQEGRDR